MFSAIILGSRPVWQQLISGIAAESGLVLVHRICEVPPNPRDLIRVINAVSPDIVFLDASIRDEALACAATIQQALPSAVIIGYGTDPLRPVTAGEEGIASVLPSELDTLAFAAVLQESFKKARGTVQKNLFAFLPSKAGNGSTTVALHTAFALANVFKKKVLVMEADLRSGVLPVMLNCAPTGSIQRALGAAPDIDRFKLDHCITRIHELDLLLSNNSLEGQFPSWHHYFQLLDFVCGRYDWILVDLPELVNPATAEVVRRAREVFVVCTQEIPSLRLAQRRCEDLAVRGVPPERIRIILNRWQKIEIGIEDVEKFLVHPIQAVIPNDYKAFRAALVAGACVPESSAPGKAFVEFARGIVEGWTDDKRRGILPSQITSLFRKK